MYPVQRIPSGSARKTPPGFEGCAFAPYEPMRAAPDSQRPTPCLSCARGRSGSRGGAYDFEDGLSLMATVYIGEFMSLVFPLWMSL